MRQLDVYEVLAFADMERAIYVLMEQGWDRAEIEREIEFLLDQAFTAMRTED